MEEVEATETRARVDRWMEEGQYLLGRVLPELLDQRERLRSRADLAEQERDKLRQELNVLQEEENTLRDENQRLRSDRSDAAQALGAVLEHVNQMVQPMTDMLQRLQVAPPAA
jgi:chromosome segregation ATPase